MFRSIFCGCTSNKNISSDVIILNVEDIIDKENTNKIEEEQDQVLIEKKVELTANSFINAIVDAIVDATVDATVKPTVDATVKPTVCQIEEDAEIIDILTEKPVTRKYLFF